MGKSAKVPPPPPPSAQELALLEKQGKLLDQYMQTIEETKTQNKQLGLITAVSSGLYDPVYQDGVLVDAKLNPERISDLQADFGKNLEINRMIADRYEKALKGELPVSEALLNRKTEDFRLLRENAAKRGVSIVGDNLDQASVTAQNSTSGNELVSRLNTTYKLAADQERRGELANLPQTIGANSLNLATGGQATYGPGATLGAEAAGVQLFPSVLAPYQNQRQLEYQRSVNNAALRSQRQSAIYGAVSNLGAQAASAAMLA